LFVYGDQLVPAVFYEILGGVCAPFLLILLLHIRVRVPYILTIACTCVRHWVWVAARVVPKQVVGCVVIIVIIVAVTVTRVISVSIVSVIIK
jgi:hypothetical protein